MSLSGLTRRERAFENKFKHDEELVFKINAHAAKLFGLWAAEKLGLGHDEAEKYADSLVDLDIDQAHIGEIEHKVKTDLNAKGFEIDEEALYEELNVHIEKAIQEFFN